MESLDDPFWRNTNGRHEKGGLLLHARDNVVSGRWPEHTWRTIWTHFDDNVDQFRKLTLLVVVLKDDSNQPHVDLSGLVWPHGARMLRTLVFLAFPPTWGNNKSTPNGAFLSCSPSLIMRI